MATTTVLPLDAKDMIRIKENDTFLVVFVNETQTPAKYHLFDLDNSEIYLNRAFNHQTHIYNHLKKHYGINGFEIIKR